MFNIYYASNGLPRQRHLAYNNMSTKDAMALRNESQDGDPVKGVKAIYQLAVMKEPPLRVITGADAYKAIMAKIEGYEENYGRFEGLSNGTDLKGCKAL